MVRVEIGPARASEVSSQPATNGRVAPRLPEPSDENGASPDEELVRPLSPMKRNVLKRVGMGMTHREIGADLAISHHTVKNHMSGVDKNKRRIGITGRLRANDELHAVLYVANRQRIRQERGNIHSGA